MIRKNALLTIVLMLGTSTLNLSALDAESQASSSTSIESNSVAAARVAADAIIQAARINAEAKIANAKIAAEAEITAAENFGLESARKWSPIVVAAISLFAALKLNSIFNK